MSCIGSLRMICFWQCMHMNTDVVFYVVFFVLHTVVQTECHSLDDDGRMGQRNISRQTHDDINRPLFVSYWWCYRKQCLSRPAHSGTVTRQLWFMVNLREQAGRPSSFTPAPVHALAAKHYNLIQWTKIQFGRDGGIYSVVMRVRDKTR